MSFSMERRFVWYRVAKTGTRSLTNLLAEHVPDYVYLNRRDSLEDVQQTFLASEPFAFTIVRNPWSRVWSAWSDKVAEHDRRGRRKRRHEQLLEDFAPGDEELQRSISSDFPTFVRLLGTTQPYRTNVHFMAQSEILGDVRLDHVGRFERYADEVGEILTQIGLDAGSVTPGHQNRSPGSGSYSERFDDETRRIVGDLYSADIERWGYRFTEG